MTDFFISYTKVDYAWARWIAWVLEKADHSTKLQTWAYFSGSFFVAEMHKAAAGAERTIVVLSPEYLDSVYGMAEWAAAFAKDPSGETGTLLPVLVRKVELDGFLTPAVHIDLVGLDETAAREKLLAGLGRGRVKPAQLGGRKPRFPADLSALPLDEIPAPGPLPPGSRMPFAANPLFVGREEDLRALARELKEEKVSCLGWEITAAIGIDGIGKTQLAAEFVHRYGRFFAGGVFWISCVDPAAIRAEVAACGWNLDLHPSFDTQRPAVQIRLVEDTWKESIPRLLVFDNCEKKNPLYRWLPDFGGGARVLVTSRRNRWTQGGLGVKAVALTTLPRELSVELLRKFRPDVPAGDEVLSRIAAELGDLPLALHLAGGFLDQFSQAPFGQPAAYLESLRQGGLLAHPLLQGKLSAALPKENEVHVARAFALSVERLSPEDPTDALALALLARTVCFVPGEPIPRDLLLKTVDSAAEDQESPSRAENALGRLTALGLLEQGEDGAVVMHRLVAELARNSGGGEEDARTAVEDALFAEAARLNKAGYPPPLLALQAHLLAVTEEAFQREDERAARLCNELGYHFETISDYLNARPLYERALAIREKVLGPEHPDTVVSLTNLGFLLSRQGFEEARPYCERVLAIREKVLGPEHPDTAFSLNNLGALLDSQGDLSGARSYYERALAIWEARLGPNHPNTKLARENVESFGPPARR